MPTNKTKDGLDVTVNSEKTVLVFGTFDGLHDGHRFFLREARAHGARLVVSVAQSSVVETIKKRRPKYALAERLAALRESGLVDEAAAGDSELGHWSAVKKWKPDIIALGYDQTALAKELHAYTQRENLPIKTITITPHKPKVFHSRLLRER